MLHPNSALLLHQSSCGSPETPGYLGGKGWHRTSRPPSKKTCDLAHLMHLTRQLHWNTSNQMCSKKHVARRSILYIWIRIQTDALFHPGRFALTWHLDDLQECICLAGKRAICFDVPWPWTSPTETVSSNMSHWFLGSNGISSKLKQIINSASLLYRPPVHTCLTIA